MRRLIFLLCFLLAAIPMLGQGIGAPKGGSYLLNSDGSAAFSGPSTTFASGAPSGACSNGSWYFNTANATLYICAGTAWAAITGTGGGGTGTVTSAAMSAPSFFSVSGSPVTTTGTLGLNYATGLTANQVLGTNSSGNAGLFSLTSAMLPSSVLNSILHDSGGEVFDVKAAAYGAVGNGVTDDTTAIQGALTAAAAVCGTAYFPPGTYLVSSLSVLTSSNNGCVSIIGGGPSGGGPGTVPASVTLESTTAEAVILTVGSINQYTYNGPTIRNINFLDKTGGLLAGGLEIINASYQHLDRLSFSNFSEVGIAPPAAPTIGAGTSGSLAAGTYFVATAYESASGPTLVGSTSSVATSGTTGSISVTSPATESGATCYEVWAGTSASTLHLQNISSGCVPIGTNSTITVLATTTQSPYHFDESAAFGLRMFGTSEGYGVISAFTNQPFLTNIQVQQGTVNGVVADRAVSALYMSGGNFNESGVPTGCGIISEGPADIQTHFESSNTTSDSYICPSGWTGRINANMETSSPGNSNVVGVTGSQMVGWNLDVACSELTGTPVSLDSNSTLNTVIIHSNGTCHNPMVVDNGTKNTIYDDSSQIQKYGVPVVLTSAPVTPAAGISIGVSAGSFACTNSSGGSCLSGGTTTVASGTAALGTNPVAGNSCATVVTVTATGVASTDSIISSPNTDASNVTGYGGSSLPNVLTLYPPYPTTNAVNFKVCNRTTNSITPSALTMNWTVVR